MLSENRAALARTLFSQGRVAYDLGNYDEAISNFQSAYEQVQEPAFLFNIAQAYRLKADCSRAVHAYRHFLRLSKNSENREAAEGLLADLRETCAKEGGATATVSVRAGNALATNTSMPLISASAPPAPPPQSNDKFVSATWGTAGTLAAIAVGISAWNFARYNDWSKENDRLANPPVGSDRSDLVDRQAANDDRLSSIHNSERLSWAIAAGAAVFLATGIVLKIVAHKR